MCLLDLLLVKFAQLGLSDLVQSFKLGLPRFPPFDQDQFLKDPIKLVVLLKAQFAEERFKFLDQNLVLWPLSEL